VFTGLISHQGRIAERIDLSGGGATFRIEAPEIVDAIAIKDSICVDGVCLTAVAVDAAGFTCDVVPETLRRSALAEVHAGDRVNLELSLRLADRLGGHLVYGHVDATARIVSKVPEGQGFRVSVTLPQSLAALIVEKGYVAVDGVSLTVAAVTDQGFEIALIPETARRTTLGIKGAGDLVSLEADPLARYAVAAVQHYATGALRGER